MLGLVSILATLSYAAEKPVTGWLQILPDGGCELNQRLVSCERVVSRLKSMHLSASPVDVIVEDAPYESVTAIVAALNGAGIKHFVFPSGHGVRPPKSIHQWIKMVVVGASNHPFPIAVLAPEAYKTWQAPVVVLSASDLADVEALATATTDQPDCLQDIMNLPPGLSLNEHRVHVFAHADERTESCLLPNNATSCNFLSDLMHLHDVHWQPDGFRLLQAFAADVDCRDVSASSSTSGENG